MTSDYAILLRTAAQIQGAMSATCIDLLSRWGRFAIGGAAMVVTTALDPLRVPAEQRQSAIEDAIWTTYSAHEQLLRAMSGASTMSVLVFLNKLDMRRGPRPARKGVTDELWGR
jgi:hypothetical protein